MSSFIQVVSPSMFLLNTQSLTEVSLSLKSLQSGAMSVVVTAVDTDCHHIVKTWMICGNTLEPTITRAFQITLPCGGTKTITKVIKQCSYKHHKHVPFPYYSLLCVLSVFSLPRESKHITYFVGTASIACD